MTLKLTEVAKARRRLAIQHQRLKTELETPKKALNVNARPIFSSVRALPA